MFIELTDHLRCPSPHAEQFLVLLPGAMDGRRVVGGSLGCPVCGRVYGIAEGVADFGDGTPTDGRTAITAEALAAFLGVSGPGGYVALAGGVTALAPELAALLPGVRAALVNPPAGVADSPVASVLRAARLPLKSSSMRGAAPGADAAADPRGASALRTRRLPLKSSSMRNVALGADADAGPAWVADPVRAVLPGL